MEENMKDTKDDKKQEQNEKINFQSLRKYLYTDNCSINYRKCNTYLLHDEFVRI